MNMVWKTGLILSYIFIGLVFTTAKRHGLYECNVNGKLIPNVFNCAEYYQCNYNMGYGHGITREFWSLPCSPGTHFNPRIGVRFLHKQSKVID